VLAGTEFLASVIFVGSFRTGPSSLGMADSRSTTTARNHSPQFFVVISLALFAP